MRHLIIVLIVLLACSAGYAQVDTIFNTKGTQRIPYYEQMYRYRVWRRVDLNEKQNMSLKSPNSNLVRLLLDNLHNGTLKGYLPNDIYFTAEQSIDDFMVKSRIQGTPVYDENQEYFSQETVSYNGKVYNSAANNNIGNLPTDPTWWIEVGDEVEYLRSEDVPSITVVEDVIFDKRRSRLYYDILGFVIIDSDGNPRTVVNYKEFSDLVARLSHDREMRIRSSVLWKNQYNPANDLSFVDAFRLRLFHGIIEKVENPDDRTILEIYTLNNRSYAESVFARWEEDMKLLEKEHNLWEY